MLPPLDDTRRLNTAPGPRATLMLAAAAKGRAAMCGRDYLIPDDIRYMAPYVLSHRLILNAKSIYSGLSVRDLVAEIVSSVEIPV